MVTACVTMLWSCGSQQQNEQDPTTSTNQADPTTAQTAEHDLIPIQSVIDEFITCKENAEAAHSCKHYLAHAICGHFGINDFMTDDGEYLSYDKLAGAIDGNDQWKYLGTASRQVDMDRAQEITNEGGAVLAVNTDMGKSNVAIVVPGELVKSNSWGLNCLNVAFFFPNKPERSFASKTINYAWLKADGIDFYVRKTKPKGAPSTEPETTDNEAMEVHNPPPPKPKALSLSDYPKTISNRAQMSEVLEKMGFIDIRAKESEIKLYSLMLDAARGDFYYDECEDLPEVMRFNGTGMGDLLNIADCPVMHVTYQDNYFHKVIDMSHDGHVLSFSYGPLDGTGDQTGAQVRIYRENEVWMYEEMSDYETRYMVTATSLAQFRKVVRDCPEEDY